MGHIACCDDETIVYDKEFCMGIDEVFVVREGYGDACIRESLRHRKIDSSRSVDISLEYHTHIDSSEFCFFERIFEAFLGENVDLEIDTFFRLIDRAYDSIECFE
jgi:hypothetical protein